MTGLPSGSWLVTVALSVSLVFGLDWLIVTESIIGAWFGLPPVLKVDVGPCVEKIPSLATAYHSYEVPVCRPFH